VRSYARGAYAAGDRKMRCRVFVGNDAYAMAPAQDSVSWCALRGAPAPLREFRAAAVRGVARAPCSRCYFITPRYMQRCAFACR